MMLTTDPSKQAESERLARDVEAYLRNGGQIKRYAHGESRHQDLTMRQRVNPRVVSAERAAKARKEGKPAPRPADKPAGKPKGVRPGPAPAAEGTRTSAILALLEAGPLTCREIAVIKGVEVPKVAEALQRLRKMGLVEKGDMVTRKGMVPCQSWRLTCR